MGFLKRNRCAVSYRTAQLNPVTEDAQGRARRLIEVVDSGSNRSTDDCKSTGHGGRELSQRIAAPPRNEKEGKTTKQPAATERHETCRSRVESQGRAAGREEEGRMGTKRRKVRQRIGD